MEFFDTSKSIIENLYLVSGPVLAIFGVLIIRQITLAKNQLTIAKEQLLEAKKQLIINSSRDSIKLAAEQVKFYMDTIVPHSNESYDKLNELGLKRVTIHTIRFIKDDVLNSPNLQEILDYVKATRHLSLELKTMNSLETFSTFFTQKVADEKVAFQAVGKSFCDLVNSINLTFSTVRDRESSYYNNTITLYRLWKSRLDELNLENEKEKLQDELKTKLDELKEAKNVHDKMDITPLGTK